MFVKYQSGEFNSKVLEIMGDPLHHKGTEIELIILDEFLHLIDADITN